MTALLQTPCTFDNIFIMLLKTICSLLLAATAMAIPHDKRKTVDGVSMYAYGTGISGRPVLADSNGIDSSSITIS